MNYLYKNRSVFLVIILLAVTLSSCSVEPAEFKEITNARIVSNDGTTARVKAEALFYNPNNSSGKVGKMDIVVSFKDQELAHVTEDSYVNVKANEDFTIPLDIDLDIKKVQDNWLGNLISILSDKSLELHFKGSVRIKMHGISRKIPVDYIEKIKL